MGFQSGMELESGVGKVVICCGICWGITAGVDLIEIFGVFVDDVEEITVK
jgi:hypothetical protein